MGNSRKSGFCKECQSRVMLCWQEPSHVAFSLLTLALIGGRFVTPLIGCLLLVVWMIRILTTAGWGCSYCGNRAISAGA